MDDLSSILKGLGQRSDAIEASGGPVDFRIPQAVLKASGIVPKRITCPGCRGGGWIDFFPAPIVCGQCGGEGSLTVLTVDEAERRAADE